MTPTERSGGHVPSDENQPSPIEFHPLEGEKVVFRTDEQGDLLLSIKGELVVRAPVDVFPEMLQQLLKSPVRADEAPQSSQTPETPPEVGTAQSEAATEGSAAEEGNQLHEFTGNPATDAKYWEWKKSGKRVAEFVLATHPEEDKTEYKRIRAFDGLAAYVRDNVRKGQTDVEVQAYGEKHWATRNKKQITGYYAKTVKVPKRYRQEKKD